eukprot:1773140-Rhodomonas_salina.2
MLVLRCGMGVRGSGTVAPRAALLPPPRPPPHQGPSTNLPISYALGSTVIGYKVLSYYAVSRTRDMLLLTCATMIQFCSATCGTGISRTAILCYKRAIPVPT